MADLRSIDIVIPSFRLAESFLSPIIHLSRPPGWMINYYLVADNPAVRVSAGIRRWEQEGKMKLIINARNVGPSETRNTGIRAGNGHWVLLLDDDIVPGENLLQAYVAAIEEHPHAIGFIGVTDFPEPVNAVTLALKINGTLGHFNLARYKPAMRWAPTANLMLNRGRLDPTLFDASLKKGGEDIELLVRNSLQSDELYISVPEAVVQHPWWNNGAVQTERMFRYGEGAFEMAAKPAIKNYTYLDFTNTGETLFLLLLLWPFAWWGGWAYWVGVAAVSVIIAELLTNWLKAVKVGKTASPAVAFYLFWAKNCHELGWLTGVLKSFRFHQFARRVDMGFVKPHPSPFRLNRWKIIKMIGILLLLTAALVRH